MDQHPRAAHGVGDAEPRPSGMRLRPGAEVGSLAEVARAVDDVEARLVRAGGDVRLATALRWVLQALGDVEAVRPLAPPEVAVLVEATAAWGVAVARALASAQAYRTPGQRRTAMALAAEESEMRLEVSVEPSRAAAEVALARASADEHAQPARLAVVELGARIHVAHRMLHARVMTAVAR